jgi:hypothetical protein
MHTPPSDTHSYPQNGGLTPSQTIPSAINTPIVSETISPPKSDTVAATLASGLSTLLSTKQFKPPSISQVIRKDLWSSETGVVFEALQWITIEAFHDEGARDTIARTGGLLAIVRAMETHSSHAPIQKAACQALEKLALDIENERAISDVGGVEAILAAMMGHLNNVSVQEAAWSALQNLTCGNAQGAMTIDTTGGMVSLVSAMRTHSTEPRVQASACGTFANLCLDHEDRLTALAQAGGFSAMADALQLHWENMEVRKEASRALADLLEDV